MVWDLAVSAQCGSPFWGNLCVRVPLLGRLRLAHRYATVWSKALPIQSFPHLLLLSQLPGLHLGLRLVLPVPASSLSLLNKCLTVLPIQLGVCLLEGMTRRTREQSYNL